jgi:hypothetical protein
MERTVTTKYTKAGSARDDDLVNDDQESGYEHDSDSDTDPDGNGTLFPSKHEMVDQGLVPRSQVRMRFSDSLGWQNLG